MHPVPFLPLLAAVPPSGSPLPAELDADSSPLAPTKPMDFDTDEDWADMDREYSPHMDAYKQPDPKPRLRLEEILIPPDSRPSGDARESGFIGPDAVVVLHIPFMGYLVMRTHETPDGPVAGVALISEGEAYTGQLNRR